MTDKTLRKALLAAFLLAVAFFTATTAPVVSEAAPAGNCIYYNNANHDTVVGKFGKDCCNNVIAWGTRTSYYSCSSACFICYPPPPQ